MKLPPDGPPGGANILVAAALTLISILLLSVIIILFLKGRKKAEKAPSAKKEEGGKKLHVELNDIMGYDFIRVQTVATATSTPKTSEPAKGSFADSQGVGMKEVQLKTTGASPVGYDDEPTPSREDIAKMKREEQKKEELERMAEEKGMVETSKDVIKALTEENFIDMEWPEEKEYLKSRSLMESYLDDLPPEEFKIEDSEEDSEYLAEESEDEPHKQELVEDMCRKIDELISNLENQDESNLPPEQRAALDKLDDMF